MNRGTWTVSNILSLSRVVLIAPIVYCYVHAFPFHRECSLLFIVAALVTDTLDGYFARRFNQVSDLGKILDPLADKIAIAVVIVLLVLFGDIPIWYMAIVLARDILIFSGGIYIKWKKGIVLASTLAGKIAVVTIALSLILAVLHNPLFLSLEWLCIWISVIMMVISFVLYARRFLAMTTFKQI
jgi:CDP-diacylglycerol--glycerol-3-phosphate 3-phosphatidyltransferase